MLNVALNHRERPSCSFKMFPRQRRIEQFLPLFLLCVCISPNQRPPSVREVGVLKIGTRRNREEIGSPTCRSRNPLAELGPPQGRIEPRVRLEWKMKRRQRHIVFIPRQNRENRRLYEEAREHDKGGRMVGPASYVSVWFPWLESSWRVRREL